jgi:hypothetical protein
VVLAALLGALASCDTKKPEAPSGETQPFEVAAVQFEQNATDSDVEVVFQVKSGAEGLSQLTITAPNGRVVTDFTASDTVTLGMRQFRFESPEPKDVDRLKAAYPEGAYTFTGTTSSGLRLQSSATLSHELPATATFVQPEPGAQGVAANKLVLKWSPVAGVEAYVVYVEHDGLGVNVTARIPGTASSFVVPDGFLTPGVDYKMGIGTVFKNGNTSYVEAEFRTADAGS